jgi:formylglycine-generating enzyme required for sulfatase activity
MMWRTIFIISVICFVHIFPQNNEQSKISLFDGSNNYIVPIKGGNFRKNIYDNYNKLVGSKEVKIKTFYISQYEITAGDYKKYCNENDILMPLFDWENTREWKDNYPIMDISWEEAADFCKWVSKKIGKIVRLPSEVEWEYVASCGVINRIYPWGNEFIIGKNLGNVADKSLANFLIKKYGNTNSVKTISNYNEGFSILAPVGSFEPNEFGVYDISGNVPEFTQDDYNNKCKVVKGSSYFDAQEESFRIDSRNGAVKDPPCYGIGFRVVIER